jgi:mono/diheme cytochrome c family protein
MNKKLMAAGIAGIAVAITVALFLGLSHGEKEKSAAAYIDPSDQALVARGKEIYAAQCASCHGATLEGQPDWRQRLPNGRLPAPPHDESGHTWHHADAVLVDIVTNGLVPGKTAPEGYESDMPAYGKILSERDIVAVLAYIKSTWPKRALEAQKRVTLNTGE